MQSYRLDLALKCCKLCSYFYLVEFSLSERLIKAQAFSSCANGSFKSEMAFLDCIACILIEDQADLGGLMIGTLFFF